jgi:hypothetical protein
MPALAELLSKAGTDQLAAVRAEAEQRVRQDLEAAAATPVSATCPECGQARPVPGAVFRSAP